MPLPPPPADGLTRIGKPISRAAAASTASSAVPSASPEMPGTTGTPISAANAFARILSPIASIAAGGGPTNTMPLSSHARANAAFSARKP